MAQYLKPDSEVGYIEDVAQIESQKFNNLRHTILGCMLGDFNEVGSYVVPKEIINELISMEKYIVQSFDNIELCRSVLKLDKQISFMVTFEGNRATLSLVEKINYEANYTLNSGKYNNINEFSLDSVETSGEIDRNVLYQRWNIKMAPSAIIDIFNCDESVLEKYFGIVSRFKYLLHTNKILLEKEEKLEEIEAEYANDIFEILAHYPKLQAEVNKALKTRLTEVKNCLNVNKPYFAKTLNEIVENVIAENVNVLEENQQKEFEVEKRNAVVKLNINRADALDIAHIQNDNTKDSEPKIIKLNTNEDFDSKTVNDYGAELVAQDKATTDRIKTQLEDGGLETKNPSAEQKISPKAKLIQYMVLLSVAGSIGLKLEEPKKDNVITSTPDVAKADVKTDSNKPVSSKSTDKANGKSNPKPIVKGGSSEKPPQKKKDGERKTPEKRDGKDSVAGVKTVSAAPISTHIYVPSVEAADGKGDNDKKTTPTDMRLIRGAVVVGVEFAKAQAAYGEAQIEASELSHKDGDKVGVGYEASNKDQNIVDVHEASISDQNNNVL